MATTIPFRLRKRGLLKRKTVVDYNCPGCHQALESDLQRVGLPDHCPVCKVSHECPGPEQARIDNQHALIQKLRQQAEEEAAAKLHAEHKAKREQQRAAEAAARAAEQERQYLVRQKQATEDERNRRETAKAKTLLHARQNRWLYVEFEDELYAYHDFTEDWQPATRDERERFSVARRMGFQYVNINGEIYLYVEARGGWRRPDAYERSCYQAAIDRGGQPWFDGPIISNNFGSVLVPPYIKPDGTRVVGHTKNPPGAGPAQPRVEACRLSREDVSRLKLG